MDHPTQEELKQFATAELEDAHFEEIAQHVQLCARCAGTLEKTGVFPKLLKGWSTDVRPAIKEGSGSLVGPYKLLQKLGEGGMGVVYMAEQEKPVRRVVALKIIKPGMDSKQVIARFEAERQALAMMDHRNIAKVLDAGTTETGRPYFAMELVKGVPITDYCDRAKLSPRERLEMFMPVCHAIQHAHLKGVIHRDIKPSNVLVTLYDGRPAPMVIDFGVAKATQQKLTERTMFTGIGQILGTLEYMSPEQAELNQLDIDTRSDVYSLGVVLYELLTGSTPFTKEQLREVGLEEMLRTIRDSDPPKPSTRLSESGNELATLSSVRKTEPAKLSKLMRGDLDWIVMKALEKDRTRRYETANALAGDIERFLANDAVEACPPSARYRLRKFAQRNKQLVTSAAIIGTILIAATAVSIWFGIWAIGNERIVTDQLQSLKIEQDKVVAAEKETRIALAASINSHEFAEEKRREAQGLLLQSLTDQMRNERLARQPGFRDRVFELARQAKTMTDDPETLHLIRQRVVDCLGDFVGFEPVNVHFELEEGDYITASAMDEFLVIGTQQGWIQIANANSGEVLASEQIFDGRIDELWFTSDGRLGCCENLYSDPAVLVFEVSESGQLTRSSRPNKEEPVSLRFVGKHGTAMVAEHRQQGPVAFLNEDTLIASDDSRAILYVVDSNGDSGGEVELGLQSVYQIRTDQSGKYVMVGGNAGYKLFAVHGRQLEAKSHGRLWSTFVDISANGRWAATNSSATLVLRSVESNAILAELPTHPEVAPRFSTNNQSLYAAHFFDNRNSDAQIWHLRKRTPERVALERHVGMVPTVTYHPRRHWLLSCGHDNTVCVWDRDGSLKCQIRGFNGRRLQSVSIEPISGQVAVTTFRPGTVELFTIDEAVSRAGRDLAVDVQALASHNRLATFAPFVIYDAQFSEDGKLLAVTRPFGVSIWERIFDSSLSKHVFTRRHTTFADGFMPPMFTRARFLPGTPYVALVSRHLMKLTVINTLTNTWHDVDKGSMVPNAWTGLARSNQFVFFIDDGNVKRWDAVKNETRTVVRGNARDWHIASSPDGRRVAFRSEDLRIAIADTETGEVLAVLPPIRTRLNSMAFSPDGSQLALSLVDGGIDVWRLDLISDELESLGLIDQGRLYRQPGGSKLVYAAPTGKLGPKILAPFPGDDHGITYLRDPGFLWAEDPVLSNDGEYLYFPAADAYSIACLRRNIETGEIIETDTVALPTEDHIWRLALSPSNDLAIACGSSSLLSYGRKKSDGKLTHSHSYDPEEGGMTFTTLCDASFSIDGRFVFLCDRQQNGILATMTVTQEGEFKHTHTNSGVDGCFREINSVLVHPNGEWLYAASGSGTIAFCTIDKETGETSIQQVVRDDEDGPTLLGSAYSMMLSDDKGFLYVSSGHTGRRRKPAVSLLGIGSDGRLTIVQSLLPGEGNLPKFDGCIGFAITPDGKRAFVCDSKSHYLLEFGRDPDNGRLTFTQTIPIGRGNSNPSGLVVTRDGRFLYVTLGHNHAIATVPLRD